MILLDFSQVSLAAIAQERAINRGMTFDKNFAIHIILNSVRANNSSFRNDFGEMLLLCDSGTWRKDRFPNYKAKRKKIAKNDAEEKEWKEILEARHEVQAALANFFPMKTIAVEGSEADDLIGIYVRKIKKPDERVLIISSDKDYQQLHRFPGVKQWMPTQKEWFMCLAADKQLMELIVRGDPIDGIPNVLSPDDVFVNPDLKQTAITKPLVEAFVDCRNNVEGLFDAIQSGRVLPKLRDKISVSTLRRNYDRNRSLIDLDYTPEWIEHKFSEALETATVGTFTSMVGWFNSMKMKRLLDFAHDFSIGSRL
jgi:hypothetical protein